MVLRGCVGIIERVYQMVVRERIRRYVTLDG